MPMPFNAFANYAPTDPRIAFWSAPHLWPIDSKDHIFAARAIIELGKAQQKNWSDSSPATALSWDLPGKLDLYTPLEEIRRGVDLLRGQEGSYREREPFRSILALSPYDSVASPFPTGAEWSQAVALAKAASEQSWSQYWPFVATGKGLADACTLGRVKTATRPIEGGLQTEQEWHFWNGEALWRRFETCRIDATAHFNFSTGSNVTSWLYIDRGTFDGFLTKNAAAAPAPDVDLASKEQVRRGRRAGRPPVYVWDKMVAEFARMVHEGEVGEARSTRQIAASSLS